MPVYNGARYLRQTLASLRWQTFADWEAVCVNDGSTDESRAILEQYASVDPRIRIVDQKNQGIVAALNAGIRAARAEWIARIDSDDVAVPERLATQWEFVRQNPDVVVVGSYMLFTDPDGFPICTERYATEHEDIERALLRGTAGSFGHPSVLMRREAVIKAGLYRKEYEWVEDIDLWLRTIQLGRVANIPQPLMRYRQHEQSVCWNRRSLQHERGHRLLTEARIERGLVAPDTSPVPPNAPRKQSSAAGKWARRAARSGYYRTAWRQWLRQASAEPLSLLTLRVTLETILRGTAALLKKREPTLAPLPDWHEWDAIETTSLASPRAA